MPRQYQLMFVVVTGEGILMLQVEHFPEVGCVNFRKRFETVRGRRCWGVEM